MLKLSKTKPAAAVAEAPKKSATSVLKKSAPKAEVEVTEDEAEEQTETATVINNMAGELISSGPTKAEQQQGAYNLLLQLAISRITAYTVLKDLKGIDAAELEVSKALGAYAEASRQVAKQ